MTQDAFQVVPFSFRSAVPEKVKIPTVGQKVGRQPVCKLARGFLWESSCHFGLLLGFVTAEDLCVVDCLG